MKAGLTGFTIVGLLILLNCLSFAAEGDSDQEIRSLEEFNACGHSALFLTLRLLGDDTTFEEVQELVGPAQGGIHSFEELSAAASSKGFRTLSVRLPKGKVPPTPCIAQFVHSQFRQNTGAERTPHFVVLLRNDEAGVTVADPPFPLSIASPETFDALFTGHALIITRDEETWSQINDAVGSHPLLSLKSLRRSAFVLFSILLFLLSRRLAFFFVVGSIVMWFGMPLSPNSAGTSDDGLQVNPKMDLGVLDPGTHEMSIPVENTSSTAIAISSVESTCSCVISDHPESVPAGSRAEVELSIGVKEGKGGSTLMVVAGNGETKRIDVSWWGRSKPRMSPPRIYARRDALDGPFRREVEILYMKDAQFEFLSAESDSGAFRGTCLPGAETISVQSLGGYRSKLSKTILEVTSTQPLLEPTTDQLTIKLLVDGVQHDLELPIVCE